MQWRSGDAFAGFDNLFDVGIRLIEVGAGKRMGFNPQVDIPAQFSEKNILVKPVDVVTVLENGEIDVAIRP